MNPKNEVTFKSHWWSVNLPADWRAVEDNECVTLSGGQFSGAVQISAARKETGFITDEDLNEFAAERLSEKISLSKANINATAFTGLYAERIKNGIFWREWWLRSGSVMLYVTYNIEEKSREAEKFLVDEIIGSLSPNG